MSIAYIVNYLNRRGYDVTYCNSFVFVTSRSDYKVVRRFTSYNSAYKYFKR